MPASPAPPPPDLQAAARAIEARIAERLGPVGARWKAELVARSRTDGGALVFAVAAPGAPRVAAKLYARRAWAAAEHEAARAAVGGRAPVARPLFCDEGLGLLVSEWVEGGTVEAAIRRGDWREELALAGRWLRRFHRPARLRPVWHEPLRALADLGDAPGRMPDEEVAAFRRAAGTLAEAAARLRPGLHRPVRLHGDLHAGNLILSPRGPVAVDLPKSRPGSRLEDLARMRVHLALLAELRPPARPFDPDRAGEVFLAAYGLRGRRARARLALAEAAELLRRWRSAAGGKPNPATVLVARALLARRGWLLALLALASGGEAGKAPRWLAGAAPAAVAAA